VYPAKRVCPSDDQQREVQTGGEPSLCPMTSGLSSSTMTFCSKSQILITAPAAAQSQYLFGEKERALISSPESKVWSGLASSEPKSHNLAVPSRPPEAQREPSGETVTVFK